MGHLFLWLLENTSSVLRVAATNCQGECYVEQIAFEHGQKHNFPFP